MAYSPSVTALLVAQLGRRAARRALESADHPGDALARHGIRWSAVEALDRRLRELGVTVLMPPGDSTDPAPGLESLWRIPDPPMSLFFCGNPALLRKPSIAIVGARRCTPIGAALAAEMAADLAQAGFVVVSGLARGIDAAAHEGALAAGSTGAILGSGFDHIYPPEHRRLADRIRQSGYVLTEYLPDAKPLGFRFPERNRLISGLCQAVVVVEASDRSGSLITARLALEQGREVMVVPGSVRSPVSRGCHRLIREGAALVESGRDVLEALGLPGIVRTPLSDTRVHPDRVALSDEDAAILLALDSTPLPLDMIAAHTGLSPQYLAARLLELELIGVVSQVAQGFVRLE
ncbi:MAG: DNA-processing protein DprA [Pseudomonadales bacterium]